VEVGVSPRDALAAAKAVTSGEAPLLALLFRLRGLPAKRGAAIFEQLRGVGFAVAEEREDELVLVSSGQPWKLRGGGATGGHVTITLRLRAAAGRLSTETVVESSDDGARRRFLRYWRVIGPFSGLVRRSWLRAAKRRAEHAAP
jgi:hypothetical protein